ncbi:hypothetical protein KCV03_g429, partial [Aureobasidium melanogenum]
MRRSNDHNHTRSTIETSKKLKTREPPKTIEPTKGLRSDFGKGTSEHQSIVLHMCARRAPYSDMKMQRGISTASAMRQDKRAGRMMWYNWRRDAFGFLSPSVSFLHSPQKWPMNVVRIPYRYHNKAPSD